MVRRWIPVFGLLLWLASGCAIDRAGFLPPAARDGAPASDVGVRDGGWPLDAVPTDGPCVAVTETCNGIDDDCDRRIDEDFDLTSDLDHCGSCERACPPDPANGSIACVSSDCRLECDAGYADCDGVFSNGCESALGSAETCGACGMACPAATPYCETNGAGVPGCVSRCTGGREQCGGSCVDTNTNPDHCGRCDRTCPSQDNARRSCLSGDCGFVCDAMFDDCDGVATNGCEQRLNTIDDCGGCGTPCERDNATATCATGSCATALCDVGWEDCNSIDSDGCERSIRSLSDCGACGIPCALDNASESCATGVCEVSACATDFDDCNRVANDGCEQSLLRDETCGSCTNACAATQQCSGGTCDCPASCPSCVATCAAGSTCLCENGCGCSLTCTEDCDVECREVGTSCTVGAAALGRFRALKCKRGATCVFDVRETATADAISCENGGTSCEVTCDGGSSACAVECKSGAACLLRCESASSCDWSRCDMGALDCPGGVKVCNRACP